MIDYDSIPLYSDKKVEVVTRVPALRNTLYGVYPLPEGEEIQIKITNSEVMYFNTVSFDKDIDRVKDLIEAEMLELNKTLVFDELYIIGVYKEDTYTIIDIGGYKGEEFTYYTPKIIDKLFVSSHVQNHTLIKTVKGLDSIQDPNVIIKPYEENIFYKKEKLAFTN